MRKYVFIVIVLIMLIKLFVIIVIKTFGILLKSVKTVILKMKFQIKFVLIVNNHFGDF